MLPAYKAAMMLQPPVLMGRRLVPLTLGHAALLQVFDTPWLDGGTAAGSDLIFAAWLCTQPDHYTALRKLRTSRCRAEAAKWGSEVDAKDLENAVDVFRKYIVAQTAAPPRYDSKSKLAAPWPWAIAAALQRYLRMTREDAWRTPVNEAMCWMAAVGALQGDDSLIPEEDELRFQKLAEMST